MKLLIQESEMWWISLMDEIRPTRGMNAKEVFKALGELFQFNSIPSSVAVEGGTHFQHGQFGDIVITRLTMYSDGINVMVPGDTNDAQAVLDVALDFMYSAGMRRPITPPTHYPYSRLTSQFENSIDNLIGPQNLFQSITDKLNYQHPTHLWNFTIQADPLKLPKRIASLNPTAFRIERRQETEAEENRYFSAANLSTAAHIEILQLMDSAAK